MNGMHPRERGTVYLVRRMMSLRRMIPTSLCLALLLVCAATGLRGLSANPGAAAGIEEKLGAPIALDAVLKAEDGTPVTLRQLINKPTILTLNYYRCGGICTPLLNSLADTLDHLGLRPSTDYQVITLSFDPHDTPEVASQKKSAYLARMKQPFPPDAWRFLTGDAQATRAVTDSAGFYFNSGESGFTHTGALIILTPQGRVSRYIYGINFLPADVQMALQEAAAGQVRPSAAKVLAFCYNYDPRSRRYVFNVTRLAGVITLLLAAVVGFVAMRNKSRGEKVKTKVELPQ